MKGLFVSCLAALAAAGCGGLPPPLSPHTRAGEGYRGCIALSDAARVRASRTSGYGWTFAIAGAGATAAGAAVIPLDGRLSRGEKLVAGSLVAAGALLLTVSRAWFHRSDAASKLAGETASILGTTDGEQPPTEKQVTAKCNAALGAWEKSRADATAVASTLQQEQKTETAKAAGNSAVRVEVEKTRQKALDFKLKALEQRPSLSVEQLDKLVMPPAEPPPDDKAPPPGEKPPTPPR